MSGFQYGKDKCWPGNIDELFTEKSHLLTLQKLIFSVCEWHNNTDCLRLLPLALYVKYDAIESLQKESGG